MNKDTSKAKEFVRAMTPTNSGSADAPNVHVRFEAPNALWLVFDDGSSVKIHAEMGIYGNRTFPYLFPEYDEEIDDAADAAGKG